MADDTRKLTPVAWSKERGFYWSPDGEYYRRVDVDALVAAVRAESEAACDERAHKLRGLIDEARAEIQQARGEVERLKRLISHTDYTD